MEKSEEVLFGESKPPGVTQVWKNRNKKSKDSKKAEQWQRRGIPAVGMNQGFLLSRSS